MARGRSSQEQHRQRGYRDPGPSTSRSSYYDSREQYTHHDEQQEPPRRPRSPSPRLTEGARRSARQSPSYPSTASSRSNSYQTGSRHNSSSQARYRPRSRSRSPQTARMRTRSPQQPLPLTASRRGRSPDLHRSTGRSYQQERYRSRSRSRSPQAARMRPRSPPPRLTESRGDRSPHPYRSTGRDHQRGSYRARSRSHSPQAARMRTRSPSPPVTANRRSRSRSRSPQAARMQSRSPPPRLIEGRGARSPHPYRSTGRDNQRGGYRARSRSHSPQAASMRPRSPPLRLTESGRDRSLDSHQRAETSHSGQISAAPAPIPQAAAFPATIPMDSASSVPLLERIEGMKGQDFTHALTSRVRQQKKMQAIGVKRKTVQVHEFSEPGDKYPLCLHHQLPEEGLEDTTVDLGGPSVNRFIRFQDARTEVLLDKLLSATLLPTLFSPLQIVQPNGFTTAGWVNHHYGADLAHPEPTGGLVSLGLAPGCMLRLPVAGATHHANSDVRESLKVKLPGQTGQTLSFPFRGPPLHLIKSSIPTIPPALPLASDPELYALGNPLTYFQPPYWFLSTDAEADPLSDPAVTIKTCLRRCFSGQMQEGLWASRSHLASGNATYSAELSRLAIMEDEMLRLQEGEAIAGKPGFTEPKKNKLLAKLRLYCAALNDKRDVVYSISQVAGGFQGSLIITLYSPPDYKGADLSHKYSWPEGEDGAESELAAEELLAHLCLSDDNGDIDGFWHRLHEVFDLGTLTDQATRYLAAERLNIDLVSNPDAQVPEQPIAFPLTCNAAAMLDMLAAYSVENGFPLTYQIFVSRGGPLTIPKQKVTIWGFFKASLCLTTPDGGFYRTYETPYWVSCIPDAIDLIVAAVLRSGLPTDLIESGFTAPLWQFARPISTGDSADDGYMPLDEEQPDALQSGLASSDIEMLEDSASAPVASQKEASPETSSLQDTNDSMQIDKPTSTPELQPVSNEEVPISPSPATAIAVPSAASQGQDIPQADVSAAKVMDSPSSATATAVPCAALPSQATPQADASASAATESLVAKLKQMIEAMEAPTHVARVNMIGGFLHPHLPDFTGMDLPVPLNVLAEVYQKPDLELDRQKELQMIVGAGRWKESKSVTEVPQHISLCFAECARGLLHKLFNGIVLSKPVTLKTIGRILDTNRKSLALSTEGFTDYVMQDPSFFVGREDGSRFAGNLSRVLSIDAWSQDGDTLRIRHPALGLCIASALRTNFLSKAFVYPFQLHDKWQDGDLGASKDYTTEGVFPALPGLKHLTVDFSDLKKLNPALERGGWDNHPWFSTHALVSLLASAPNLQSLTIIGCQSGSISPVYPQDVTILHYMLPRHILTFFDTLYDITFAYTPLRAILTLLAGLPLNNLRELTIENCLHEMHPHGVNRSVWDRLLMHDPAPQKHKDGFMKPRHGFTDSMVHGLPPNFVKTIQRVIIKQTAPRQNFVNATGMSALFGWLFKVLVKDLKKDNRYQANWVPKDTERLPLGTYTEQELRDAQDVADTQGHMLGTTLVGGSSFQYVALQATLPKDVAEVVMEKFLTRDYWTISRLTTNGLIRRLA